VAEDLIILPRDLKMVRKGTNTGYCRPGLERWAAQHGYSLKLFLKNGIPLSKLTGIEDPFLEKVIETARAREAAEGDRNGLV